MRKEIWIVNMGIDVNVKDQNPIRFFHNKKDAYNWVKDCVETQLERLDEYKHQLDTSHLNIGNSFFIEKKVYGRGS